MEKIHYICNYDDYNNNRHLNTQPSAVTKINYIKSVLKEIGLEVVVFSTAECVKNVCCWNKKARFDKDSRETILYQLTFGRTNLLYQVASRLLLWLQLILYLLFHVKKNEKILVYHSLHISRVIYWVGRIKKLNVYFEVEEIFHAVYKFSPSKIQKEINGLKGATGYILVNDIMNDKGSFGSSVSVCYGVYKPEGEDFIRERTDDKIHVVYAGVISSKGSDVYLAVDVARYLPSNYIIHILGYGSDESIEELNRYIEDCNKTNKSKVVYEGCLLGDKYLKFLSGCQIGLCTRVLEDNLSDYTFPSKVMVYMANQLVPICTPISCIIRSKIKDYIGFSADTSPKSIAESIIRADISLRYKYKSLLSELNNEFIASLKSLFCYADPSSN